MQKEGVDSSCVYFRSFESGGVDGEEDENIFSIFLQMKELVLVLCRIIAFYPNNLVHPFYYNIQYTKLNIT